MQVLSGENFEEMGFGQEWVVQDGANQLTIPGHKQPCRHATRAATGESYLFAARNPFSSLQDGFLNCMFNVSGHGGRLADAHQIEKMKKFKDRQRYKPGCSGVADQAELHRVTTHGFLVFSDRVEHLARQILPFEQAQQVTFLKIGISRQGEQDLFCFFLKKPYGLMSGRNRCHFSAFGQCVV